MGRQERILRELSTSQTDAPEPYAERIIDEYPHDGGQVMKLADMILRFLCLAGIGFALTVFGIGLGLVVMLATYYTLIAL